jgi:hypothetical protein
MSKLREFTAYAAFSLTVISPRVVSAQSIQNAQPTQQSTLQLRVVDTSSDQTSKKGYKLDNNVPVIKGVEVEGNFDINVHNGARKVLVKFGNGRILLAFQKYPCKNPYADTTESELNYRWLDKKTGVTTPLTDRERNSTVTDGLVRDILQDLVHENGLNCLPAIRH